MDNDRRIYRMMQNCGNCQVYGTDGAPFMKARVALSKTEVTLYFPTYKLKDMRVTTRVDFYDDSSGVIRCLCELLIRRNPAFPQMSEGWMADCRVVQVMEIIQRQKDLRVRVRLDAEFSGEGGKIFFGTVENISAGGIYVNTLQKLNLYEEISFHWIFGAVKRSLRCKVIRVTALPGGRSGYGCRFLNLTYGAEEDIRYFVYKNQKSKGKEGGAG